MIHGTWMRGTDHRWEVKIPWDEYWGNAEPQPMDIVLVESKSGEVKAVQIAEVVRARFGWICPVYDEHYIGVAPDGFDPYEPDDGDFGGF